jgi:hypothetical protein
VVEKVKTRSLGFDLNTFILEQRTKIHSYLLVSWTEEESASRTRTDLDEDVAKRIADGREKAQAAIRAASTSALVQYQ